MQVNRNDPASRNSVVDCDEVLAITTAPLCAPPFAFPCDRASLEFAEQVSRGSPTIADESRAGAVGTEYFNRTRGRSSSAGEGAEDVAEEACDEDAEELADDEPAAGPSGSADAHPARVSIMRKRGRPPDSPAQKAVKAAKRADDAWWDALLSFLGKRDKFKFDATFKLDPPSILERRKQVLINERERMFDLKVKAMVLEEEAVEARLEELRARVKEKCMEIIKAEYDERQLRRQAEADRDYWFDRVVEQETRAARDEERAECERRKRDMWLRGVL